MKKIIVIGCYKPPSLNDEYFLDKLHGALSFYSTTFHNFLSLGVFNISSDDERLKEFCNSFSLGPLIKTSTFYMGTNPSSIDHIIKRGLLWEIYSTFYLTPILLTHKIPM